MSREQCAGYEPCCSASEVLPPTSLHLDTARDILAAWQCDTPRDTTLTAHTFGVSKEMVAAKCGFSGSNGSSTASVYEEAWGRVLVVLRYVQGEHSGESSDVFTEEDIAVLVRILLCGTMRERLSVLVAMMDSDGDGFVSYDDACMHLQVTDDVTMTKIGFLSVTGHKQSKTIDQFEEFFNANPSGEVAIKLFCARNMNCLLQQRLVNQLITNKSDGGGNDNNYKNNRNVVGDKGFSRLGCFPSFPKSKSEWFTFVLLVAQIILWIWNYYSSSRRGYHYWICVAKAFGLNIRILTILLFFTMARTTLLQLSTFKSLRFLVPLGFSVELHAFIGFCVFGHSLGHVLAHLVYRFLFVSELGFLTAFCRADSITGLLLLLIIVCITFNALHRNFSSEAFTRFTRTHFYMSWVVLNILHVPNLWLYFLVVGIYFLSERCYDFFRKTIYVNMGDCRPGPNGVTFVQCLKKGLDTPPGCYFFIKVPSISLVEWHAFSIASSPSSPCATFHIDAAGDWTRKLYALVSNQKMRENSMMYIQGPFLAPAHYANRIFNRSILCVASGNGITPFFGLMATRVEDEHARESDETIFMNLFGEEKILMPSKPSLDATGNVLSVFRELWCFLSDGILKYLVPSNRFVSCFSSSALEVVENVDSTNCTSGDSNRSEYPPQKFSSIPENIPDDTVTGRNKGDNISVVDEDTLNIEVCRVHVDTSIAPPQLHVMWSIRDIIPVRMYIDYVMEVLAQQRNHRRQSVQMEISITGLGSSDISDYTLSHTFILLAIESVHAEYVSINFGRADVDEMLNSCKPKEVFYCGGHALKNSVGLSCTKRNIAFYHEEFGAVCTAAVKFYSAWATITDILRKKLLHFCSTEAEDNL
jgi:hypothetical protein